MQGFENLSDCHLHCHFSSDSEASPESMIDNAVRLGLSHICFTDHNDYDYPKEDGKTVFLLDLDAYLEKISVLKKIYKDKIDVRIGVEQGLQPPAKTRKAPEIPAQQPEPAIQSQYVMPEYSGKSLF